MPQGGPNNNGASALLGMLPGWMLEPAPRLELGTCGSRRGCWVGPKSCKSNTSDLRRAQLGHRLRASSRPDRDPGVRALSSGPELRRG
jgi:hypothetical protein